MRVYLIRHGETTGDLEHRYGGEYDDHLSVNGIKQAKNLGKKLRNKNIRVIYHSPKIRAFETAKIVADIINADMIEIDDIRERNNYGILSGMKKSEAIKKYSEEVKKLQTKKLYHNVKGSEDYDFFKNRVILAFKKIIFDYRFDDIAIITHGGVISCLIREYFKLGEFKKIGDCAILEIENKDENVSVVSIENAELKKDLDF